MRESANRARPERGQVQAKREMSREETTQDEVILRMRRHLGGRHHRCRRRLRTRRPRQVQEHSQRPPRPQHLHHQYQERARVRDGRKDKAIHPRQRGEYSRSVAEKREAQRKKCIRKIPGATPQTTQKYRWSTHMPIDVDAAVKNSSRRMECSTTFEKKGMRLSAMETRGR